VYVKNSTRNPHRTEFDLIRFMQNKKENQHLRTPTQKPFEVYCLSNTIRLLKDWPLVLVPLDMMVRTFPSSETTAFVVSTTLPAFLKLDETELLSTRL